MARALMNLSNTELLDHKTEILGYISIVENIGGMDSKDKNVWMLDLVNMLQAVESEIHRRNF